MGSLPGGCRRNRSLCLYHKTRGLYSPCCGPFRHDPRSYPISWRNGSEPQPLKCCIDTSLRAKCWNLSRVTRGCVWSRVILLCLTHRSLSQNPCPAVRDRFLTPRNNHEGPSINDRILNFTTRLAGVKKSLYPCLRTIFMSRLDLKHAFKQLFRNISQMYLLATKVDEFVFIGETTSMGLR